jgi:hypothetical protein
MSTGHALTALQISSIRKGCRSSASWPARARGRAPHWACAAGKVVGRLDHHTDGLRAVLILAERRAALSNLDFFDWERLVD